MLRTVSLCAFTLFVATANMATFATDWPQFRGATGDGHASGGGYALTWSETEQIKWKVPVDGLGWSSPSIVGNQIWLTTAVDEGKSLRAVCIARDSGKMIHDFEVIHKDEPGRIHSKNSHASPSPIIEGDRVYLHFGTHGTACVSTEGKVLWKTLLEYDHRHGPAGSPALYKNLLVINCDGYENQYVVALDKRDGHIVWRKERDARHAYCTPVVINVDGKDQILSIGADAAIAYEPNTGKEIWRVTYKGYSNVPRPVVTPDMVYICTGYDRATLLAVQLKGNQGDVTATHIPWQVDKSVPLNPSPVLVGKRLFMISDNGIATCLDVSTGKPIWQERVGGNYSASLVLAEGRIYITDEVGKTTVIAASDEYQKLAENQLEGRSLATPTFVDGAIFLRTDTHLYRIEK